MTNPARLFLIAARAGIDHEGDDPAGWGQGSEGYAVRVASRVGALVMRENLAFAVRAFDQENPRYFHSQERTAWKRTGYALSRTFVARNAAGGSLLADVATPFIAQTWRPEAVTGGRALRSAGMSLGFDAVRNVGSEFWPDIRKKLHH